MIIKTFKVEVAEILQLRSLFLQENNIQVRYNSHHERGWTDSYLITHDDDKIGYGSIKGNENNQQRDTIFEFYLIPSFRDLSGLAFSELLYVSKATLIECQSNDKLLSLLLYQRAQNINANVILFKDELISRLSIDNVIFRSRTDSDIVFEHNTEPAGDYVLELNGKIVATGGFFLHYNFPYADLYMEVKEEYRRQGLGSFLIQELKKQCYLTGRVPAARCNIENIASRNTLIKAGFTIAGYMLMGIVNSSI
jgi:GNAT superfamily N-acetyltransferase